MDLFLAANSGNLAKVRELLAEGIDVNAKNHYLQNPLHIAAQNGHKDVVELLISKGGDVNAQCNNGFTPLHSASQKGHKDVIEQLIAKGANVNAKSNAGITPLHFAVSILEDANYNEICEVIELLIAKGADINAQFSGVATPIDHASRRGYRGVVELMIAKAAIADNLLPAALAPFENEIDPEIFRKACGGDGFSMGQLVGIFLRINDFSSALFWHKEMTREAQSSDMDKRLERDIRNNLRQKIDPGKFADMADAGPDVILNVSLGWKLEKFSGGVIPSYDPSLFLDSAALNGRLLEAGVYRITAPPYRAVGLSYGDIVVTTTAYQGKLFIADILLKSGCRTLIAIPDDPLFERGVLVKCLENVGAGGKIHDDNRKIGINIPPHVPLVAVAQILSDWEWDVAWQYLDPNLKDNMTSVVDLPVPITRPLPPEHDHWPEWADDLTLLIFDDEARKRSYYSLAQILGSNIFRIKFPDPQGQQGVSIGDIYEGESQTMGWPTATAGRLLEKSGNRTVWLDILGARRKSDPLFTELKQLGCVLVACTGEWNGKEICVSIPPNVDIGKILETLQAVKAGGRSIHWRVADPIMQMSNDTRMKIEAFLEAMKELLLKPDTLARFKGKQNIKLQNEKWSVMLRFDLLVEAGIKEAIALQEAEEQFVRDDYISLRLLNDDKPNQTWVLIK